MVTTALFVVLAIGLLGAVVWLARALRRELRGELEGLRVDTRAELAARSADLDRRLGGLNETLDRRLDSASSATARISTQLGQLGEATVQMNERVRDLARLEQALRPPKARGGFGELLLGNLLRDRLPREAYELQYTFPSGERVDAVIRVDRLVPVDAKFPLDNFQRALEAESDDERAYHEKAFARDLKGHIETIAAKYVRPDEGTYDFALMYLPSESVYYELVCGKTGALYSHALERRVFPVSPTTLVAYLQVISLGLRGLQIEQHAQEVMAYVAELQRDFGRFRDDFELVGKHLGNAKTKFDDAEKRLDRFDSKLERAAEQEVLDAAAEVRALDAA
ncbi:MAG TPA: DNA recombination protein RmuC [Gaiellaceae bacterium]|jgi:DNA recombination protein RmuC|nr:DNA recombination protein RmuC [Gaiellaceae bacterium]